MTNLTVTDSFRSLEAEVRQLREHVQIQARHNEVIEAQLANLQDKLSMESEAVTIRDEIPPLLESVWLNSADDREAPYQSVDTPYANEPVRTDQDWWPAERKICNYLVPNSGWQNHSIQGTTSLVIAFSMFGLKRTEIESYVDRIRHQQSVSANFVPIFLTDSSCFDVFRRFGFVFEYFPSPEKRRTYGGSMDWDAYAAKRLDLLIRKWGIAKMIVFGKRTILTDSSSDLYHDGSNLLSAASSAEARDTIRESLGYRPDDRVFIHFGRIMRYKGADDLLYAFSSLKATNAKLIIAGKILDPLPIAELPDEVRARIAIYEGPLDQADLSRLVRAADFAVLPYRRVLTSGSVLFAMSAGVPVIVPNLPSLIEMVRPEREGLLFEPDSRKDLAAKLREAASMNETQRHALSDNALEAAKKYDWGKLGDAYATLLLQSVEEAPSEMSPARDQPCDEPPAPHRSLSGIRAA